MNTPPRMSAHRASAPRVDEPMTIAGLATEYAQGRDPEVLQRLRLAVRHSSTFSPHLDLAHETTPLLARGDHAEIIELVHGRMPGAFFSPEAHTILAAAYEALGDATRAVRERRTAQLALAAILSSGDGSVDRPWTVLRVSDEYDVLRAQRRTSRSQRKVVRHERALDHHVCDDGSEVWFDIDLLELRDR